MLVAALSLAGPHPGVAQVGLRDTSPHRVAFVRTPDGARLEVLDWGGRGEPLVLVPGLGSTAHVFDTLAPTLRDRFRVIAVTRRGFGASTRATGGYDTPTLADDILRAMDARGIRRAVLAGHSLGGAEVTWLAVHDPARVAGVALLESYCYGCPPPKGIPSPPSVKAEGPPLATDRDRASVQAWAVHKARIVGAALPPGEVLATVQVDRRGAIVPDARVTRAIAAVRRGATPSDLRHVTVPAVLVLGFPRTARDLIPWDDAPTRSQLASAAAWLPFVRWSKREWATRFMQLTARGTVVMVPGAPHHVFLSDPGRVAEALQALAARADGAPE